MKPTLTFEEAAKYLNISHSSLTDLVTGGDLPGAKISQCWVFRDCDIADYLAEQVRIQTEQRREAAMRGTVAKVKPTVATVRSARKVKPELSAYQVM